MRRLNPYARNTYKSIIGGMETPEQTEEERYIEFWIKYIEKWKHLPDCPTIEYIREEAKKVLE